MLVIGHIYTLLMCPVKIPPPKWPILCRVGR